MDGALDAPVAGIGGKASSLSRLAARGIPVPQFFVVGSHAFQTHLRENKITLPAGRNPPDPTSLAPLRRRIAEGAVPDEVGQPVLERYAKLSREAGHGVVAVRSSGADEDSAGASFAGQFSSLLGVSGNDALLQGLTAVWASCLSEDALAYRRAREIQADITAFGVVVQTQVFADKAGVLFTRHPLEPGEDLAYLEANFGTGESVVGGMVTPDSATVSRSTGEVVEMRIGSKRRMTVVSKDRQGSRTVETPPARQSLAVLSASEAEEIVRTGLSIEELMGLPQDIEWAVEAGRLWILQARPQTGAL